MNFKFFESLTKEEAQKYLDDFLYFGKNRGVEILKENVHFTIEIDFSMESLSPIIKTLITIVKTVPRPPDETVPDWIRATEEYQKGLYDFDETSKSIVLAAAYYLGETFVKNYKQLSWAIGNTKYAQGNMPVITPFKYNMEMPPILIAENSFRKVISEMSDDASVNIALESWIGNIPT
jgi:hypothetical protein